MIENQAVRPERLVNQSTGSKNKSGATAQPWRTPADIENQSETWPSTLAAIWLGKNYGWPRNGQVK